MEPRNLELRDEILQVLFWMQGEGLGEDADAGELAIWLAAGADRLAPVLAWMQRDGLVAPGGRDGAFRLTDLGLAEGGRRFTESFADAGLGVQGHGECAPGCDCLEHGHEHCHHGGHAGERPGEERPGRAG